MQRDRQVAFAPWLVTMLVAAVKALPANGTACEYKDCCEVAFVNNFIDIVRGALLQLRRINRDFRARMGRLGRLNIYCFVVVVILLVGLSASSLMG